MVTNNEIQILDKLNLITLCISIFSALIIIVIYKCYQDLRNFAFKLVLILITTGVLGDIFVLICSFFLKEISKNNSSFCSFEGFLVNFLNLLPIFWSAVLAFSLIATLVYEIKRIENFLKFFYYFTFMGAFILSIIPLFFGDYKFLGDFCWIKNTKFEGFLLRMLCYYLPFWLAMLFNFFSYAKILHFLITLRQNELNFPDEFIKMIKQLLFYPIIITICGIFATIDRIYELANDDSDYYLKFLHLLFGNLHGFFNAVVFGLTPAVRIFLYEKCCICNRKSLTGSSNVPSSSQSNFKKEISLGNNLKEFFDTENIEENTENNEGSPKSQEFRSQIFLN